jgi:hypothetical protein
MTETSESVRAFVDALRSGDPDRVDTLDGYLADSVVIVGPRGRGEGVEQVVGVLREPTLLGMVGQATWSAPEPDGSGLRVRATLPSTMPVGGFDYILGFDDGGRITSIQQQMLPPPPLDPSPLALGDDVREMLAGALANGTPTIVAYVARDGRPHLSLRATTQLLAPDCIGMWVRDPEGGLLKAVGSNPNVTIWYRDTNTRANFQFYGRARRDDSEEVRTTIFDGSPEPERNLDPGRRGVAVVIDVDRVEGSGPGGRVLMVRGA